ncbi:SNARE domain protein [Aspergillus bombycis]|uniref:SNARE domain protein n=1 Tax=Aspergillus bombycis TaxID=109264 RepID=A0A1F8A035_9EURO|nr:SNARE domain protein [Aspergillus bombycis]OGM44829.1 SNARE domain protein [Aspergillus bombycis]
MRCHGISTFDPVLTLNPRTGEQRTLTVHNLSGFLERQVIAHKLACQIVPSVWGPFSDEESPKMNYQAEHQLVQRLERGLYVLFHMADIARDTYKTKQKINPLIPDVTGRLLVLTRMLEEYHEIPRNKRRLTSFQEYASHAYTVLKWGYREVDIGRRRLKFRGYLDEQTEIDFHTTLRMLRELTERMLLRHGPRDWHRDARNEYSVTSWFLLKQSPRSLAKLLLSPQDECCGLEEKASDSSVRKCHFSDPLDDYWKAWKNVPELGCRTCDCKRQVKSWSVKPALIDDRGRQYNRAAEKYLKDMWTQRNVGLHQVCTMGYFNIVL